MGKGNNRETPASNTLIWTHQIKPDKKKLKTIGQHKGKANRSNSNHQISKP